MEKELKLAVLIDAENISENMWILSYLKPTVWEMSSTNASTEIGQLLK